MVRNIMAINTPEADYFLINHFKRGDFINFVPEIQLLIKRGKGYFAKNAIEKMPDELLVRSDLQAFFAEAFSNLGYFAQMVLLEKLQNRTISNQLANVLIRNVTVDLYQNELIFKWLTCNFDKLNDPNTIKIIQNLKRSINKTN